MMVMLKSPIHHFVHFLKTCFLYNNNRTLHSCNITSSVTITPSNFDANQKLNALGKSGLIDQARQLFDKIPNRDEFTWNTMIAAYSNSGRLNEARQLFCEIPQRTSITWSSLISGYCRYGNETEALYLFWKMQYENHKPSQFTLGSILRMCSTNCMLSKGEQIHAYAVKTQFDTNVFVVTGLVDMYAKCRRISEAEFLFGKMSHGKNHVTWTAMINGYSQNGNAIQAIECFRDMHKERVEANQYTYPSVLTACAAVSAHGFGAQVHGCIIQGGFSTNVFVQSSLVDMYAKCGDLGSANKVLETMEINDVVSWNSMIVGCVRQGFEEQALLLFQKMHARNMEIDDFTYPSVLNCFAFKKDLRNASSVHTMVFKTGFEDYKLVANALIDMYAKQGNLSYAHEVFHEMDERDVISWTSLVTGYAHNKSYDKAINMFCKMRIAGIKPDQIVIASILSSCAELTVLEFGQQVHSNFIKSGFSSSLSVDNSLVTMYANCGCIEDATKIFNSMQARNVITWTALIVGYAQNGKANESLRFYDEMISSGTKPDFITFIGLLFACSHAGLVEQARMYFESMQKVYSIMPGPDHYACMIDLLGRSGKMDDAVELLNKMNIKPDSTIWKALLSACRVHGHVELAENAAKNLFESDPHDPVPYVMLSNIYSSAGKWDEAAKIRKMMKSRGVYKEPGRSWIEMNGKIYTFMSEDRSHPMTKEIYSKIDEVMMKIREQGYVPDMNFSLHDVNEEVKELALAHHGEKLAVAFGLIFLPRSMPIRIYKNLRVCGDCHSAMKFISRVYNRHIILRDSNCFHHFREGMCSCGDYW